MAFIDVGQAVIEVANVAIPIAAVGFAILMVFSTIRAFKSVKSAVGYPVDSVAKSPAIAADAEYQRLGDVWQGWTDQAAAARAAGGVAPGAEQSLSLYNALVARGMDAQDAISAVETRNAAVARSDLLAEQRDQVEHSAIVNSSSQDIDATVKLGGGWK